jgi:hypothetical protein
MEGEISGSHGGECEVGLLRDVIWYKFTDVSEVLAASIIRSMSTCTGLLIMEAGNISETSIDLLQITWRSIPEDSHLNEMTARRFSSSAGECMM